MEAGTPSNVSDTIESWRSDDEIQKTGKRREYHSPRMSKKNFDVVSRWIKRWINNAASNFPVMKRAPGLDMLRGAARGLPVLCVGIGPSLDAFLPHASAVAKKMLVIATDAALAPLLAAGVDPDLVVNYDCRDEQESLWRRIEDCPRARDLVLLANSCAAPCQLATWPGKLMGFNMAQGDDEFVSNVLPTLYPDLGALPNVGTVGNVILVLATLMEAAKIYLVGYDFTYEKTPAVGKELSGWRYRCKDFVWGEATPEFPKAGFRERENKVLYDNDERMKGTLDFKDGDETFRSDEILWNYRRILLDLVGKMDIPAVDVGGASLRRLEHMTVEDFVFALKDLPQFGIGESVVPHLATLIQEDPRAGLRWNISSRLWRDVPPAPALPVEPAEKRIVIDLCEAHR